MRPYGDGSKGCKAMHYAGKQGREAGQRRHRLLYLNSLRSERKRARQMAREAIKLEEMENIVMERKS